MNKFKLSSVFLFLLVLANISFAKELVVIVNSANQEVLTTDQIRNLYLGKLKSFPSGMKVRVLAMPEESDAYDKFATDVLRRSKANLNSYWARMLFSSKGTPPKVMQSAADILSAVAGDVEAIGYLWKNDIQGVKVRIVQTY